MSQVPEPKLTDVEKDELLSKHSEFYAKGFFNCIRGNPLLFSDNDDFVAGYQAAEAWLQKHDAFTEQYFFHTHAP